MRSHRTCTALIALVIFVTGGVVLPVLHRVDHTAEWYEQQAAAHRHGQPHSDAIAEACADLGAELQDCEFCQRNFFNDAAAAETSSGQLPDGTLAHLEPAAPNISLDARQSTRAPPLNA